MAQRILFSSVKLLVAVILAANLVALEGWSLFTKLNDEEPYGSIDRYLKSKTKAVDCPTNVEIAFQWFKELKSKSSPDENVNILKYLEMLTRLERFEYDNPGTSICEGKQILQLIDGLSTHEKEGHYFKEVEHNKDPYNRIKLLHHCIVGKFFSTCKGEGFFARFRRALKELDEADLKKVRTVLDDLLGMYGSFKLNDKTFYEYGMAEHMNSYYVDVKNAPALTYIVKGLKRAAIDSIDDEARLYSRQVTYNELAGMFDRYLFQPCQRILDKFGAVFTVDLRTFKRFGAEMRPMRFPTPLDSHQFFYYRTLNVHCARARRFGLMKYRGNMIDNALEIINAP